MGIFDDFKNSLTAETPEAQTVSPVGASPAASYSQQRGITQAQPQQYPAQLSNSGYGTYNSSTPAQASSSYYPPYPVEDDLPETTVPDEWIMPEYEGAALYEWIPVIQRAKAEDDYDDALTIAYGCMDAMISVAQRNPKNVLDFYVIQLADLFVELGQHDKVIEVISEWLNYGFPAPREDLRVALYKRLAKAQALSVKEAGNSAEICMVYNAEWRRLVDEERELLENAPDWSHIPITGKALATSAKKQLPELAPAPIPAIAVPESVVQAFGAPGQPQQQRNFVQPPAQLEAAPYSPSSSSQGTYASQGYSSQGYGSQGDGAQDYGQQYARSEQPHYGSSDFGSQYSQSQAQYSQPESQYAQPEPQYSQYSQSAQQDSQYGYGAQQDSHYGQYSQPEPQYGQSESAYQQSQQEYAQREEPQIAHAEPQYAQVEEPDFGSADYGHQGFASEGFANQYAQAEPQYGQSAPQFGQSESQFSGNNPYQQQDFEQSASFPRNEGNPFEAQFGDSQFGVEALSARQAPSFKEFADKPEFGSQNVFGQSEQQQSPAPAPQFGQPETAQPTQVEQPQQAQQQQDFGFGQNAADFGNAPSFGQQDFGNQDFAPQNFNQPDFAQADFGQPDFGNQDFANRDFAQADFGQAESGQQFQQPEQPQFAVPENAQFAVPEQAVFAQPEQTPFGQSEQAPFGQSEPEQFAQPQVSQFQAQEPSFEVQNQFAQQQYAPPEPPSYEGNQASDSQNLGEQQPGQFANPSSDPFSGFGATPNFGVPEPASQSQFEQEPIYNAFGQPGVPNFGEQFPQAQVHNDAQYVQDSNQGQQQNHYGSEPVAQERGTAKESQDSAAKEGGLKFPFGGPVATSNGEVAAGIPQTTQWSAKRFIPEYNFVASSLLFPMPSFVAVKFDVANQDPRSVCRVVLIKVQKGEVVRQIDTMVDPARAAGGFTNSHIHGISEAAVAGASKWPEIAMHLRDFIGDLPVWTVNASLLAKEWKALDEHYLVDSRPMEIYDAADSLHRIQPEYRDTQLVQALADIAPNLRYEANAPSDALAATAIVAYLNMVVETL